MQCVLGDIPYTKRNWGIERGGSHNGRDGKVRQGITGKDGAEHGKVR